MNKQEVYLSITQSGQMGYFTNGMLAWPLSQEEYYKPIEWHERNAANLDFKLIER